MDNNIGEKEEEEEEEEERKESQEVDGVHNDDSIYNKSSPIELKINIKAIDMEKYEEMINKYFKQKHKYENKIEEAKKKIRKSAGSSKEKRIEYKKFIKSIKCIKCGNKGGTLFTNENNVLKQVCNASEPCSLNVEIKRIVFDNLIDLEMKCARKLNTIKKQIVIANMDKLLNYKSKEETVELFESTMKVSLKKSSEDLRLYSELLNSIENRNKKREQRLRDEINGLNIANGDQILNDELNGLNNIADWEQKLRDEINGLNIANGNQVEITNNVNKYINNIIPILKELRELKYSYSGTQCEKSLNSAPCTETMENVYAIQIPFTIKKMEVETNP